VAQAWDKVVAVGTQDLLSSRKQRDMDHKNVIFKVQVGDGLDVLSTSLSALYFIPPFGFFFKENLVLELMY